jgi:hypothetical protein
MHKSIAAVIAVSAAALAGCQVHAQEAGGATISRTYQVGTFQQIEVAGPYDVEVRTGGNPGVSARGSEKLLGRTVVEVKGDKLIIHPEQRNGFHLFSFGSRGSAKFIVTVPQLSGATIAGSGGIKVDRVAGQSFEGTIAGSGGLNLGTTEVQSLKLTIAGSGGIKAGTGNAKLAEYDIEGSGGIQAQAIAAEQAKVSIAGSGSIQANATGTANVDVMGSGDVNITGGAKCNVSKAGSGNVRCS